MLVAEEVNGMEVTLDYFGMLELLTNHYGDGSVYLSNGTSSQLFDLAKEYGYVNDEGFLTREGRQLVTQHRQR